MTFETRYAALGDLIADEEARGTDAPARNEAQTRFDLIDRVLREVLGWPVDRIAVEKHDETGFTDYELREVGTVAILEAKNDGVAFTLPESTTVGKCSIESLVNASNNGGLKSAMQQVVRYASSRGTAICIISNGPQWVAFLGSRTDGIPPLEGKAIVFPSFAAIRTEFVTFHECLSHEALLKRRLFSELSLAAPAPPAPLSAGLTNYPGVKRRNSVQTNLQFLGQALLEDIPRDEQYSEAFLTHCYASSGALSSYANLSRELLASRNATMLQELGAIERPAALKKGVNPELSTEALAAAASHRPIVLLGGVGVGKSTFIHHLVEVDAKSVFKDAIAIRVDYGSGATFTEPSEYALDQIEQTLRDGYEIDVADSKFVNDLYRKDLQRFDRGVVGLLKESAPTEYAVKKVDFLSSLIENRSEHLKLSVDRISRSRRRQVVIFLDNVDQRDHEDQNRVFLTANEIASGWSATVFVTLRPETYYTSRRYGAVSGYHPRVFSISPPRCDIMLKKRIQFALEILGTGSDARLASGVGITSESLELFLRVLDRNLSLNRQLTTLLDNLAGGDMRRALDFVTQFIGSGHVDTEKIIGIERADPGKYFIPMHEFLRSLLHGDGEFYDPENSPIANLWSIDRPDSRNHFLAPISLHHIRAKGEARDGSGYIDLSDVYHYLQGLGFDGDAVDFTLSKLGHHKLIEAPLSDFDPKVSSQVRVTTVGAYTLSSLPGLFTYNDAVLVDTPIVEAALRQRIIDARTLVDRVERAHIFKLYLDESWNAAGIQSDGWDWSIVSAALEGDMKLVCAKAGIDYESVTVP